MGIKFTNNAEAQLSIGIDNSVTELTLKAGEGSYFPTIVLGAGDYFFATIVDTSGNLEIIKVTEHQAGTDVFQVIERAADGIRNQSPVARAWLTNDKVQARVNAQILEDWDGTVGSITDHIADTSTHGIDSVIVGEDEEQTLTNKTLTSPIVSEILTAVGKVGITLTEDGAVTINHNENPILATELTGIGVTSTAGNEFTLTIGAGNLIIRNTVEGGDVTVQPNGNGGIKMVHDSQVELYHNNSLCAKTQASNGFYVYGNMSAQSITDRTPFYDGPALKEVNKIKGKDGKIDHSTLPKFAQVKAKQGKTERDLGGMISVLIKAVQELSAEIEELKK